MSMTVLYFLSLCVILKKNVDFNNKNNSTSFEDMVAQIKGVHECCFIHRRQKNRDGKLLDELAIKN